MKSGALRLWGWAQAHPVAFVLFVALAARVVVAVAVFVGHDFYLAVSPERIEPGNATFNTRNVPKVVGGITPECTTLAAALYAAAIPNIVPVSSTRVAEMVKLLENTFRAVNIGMVNELALMCDSMGIDVWEVIDAAATKPFGFMKFTPGPGLGGHCIPIDPLYLSWKMKSFQYNARFIELASEINTNMPRYVVTRMLDAMNDRGQVLKGSKVLVLGVAYKPDIDDVRESPALDVIGLLQKKGAQVEYHDPHVPEAYPVRKHDVKLRSVTLTKDALAGFDAVVISTAHSAVDYGAIAAHARMVVDTRDALRDFRSKMGDRLVHA